MRDTIEDLYIEEILNNKLKERGEMEITWNEAFNDYFKELEATKEDVHGEELGELFAEWVSDKDTIEKKWRKDMTEEELERIDPDWDFTLTDMGNKEYEEKRDELYKKYKNIMGYGPDTLEGGIECD